jgi:hypothetical protein
MADEQSALVPVEQQVVSLFGREIIAVRLPDGRIAAVVNSMCEALGLARTGQHERIREDEILAEQLLPVRIDTAGGPQVTNALTAWAIPSWLHGVRVSRVAPEKREAIMAFRREAADVLYRHFAQRQPTLPPPSQLVPAEPVQEPVRPGTDATLDDWQAWRQAMRAWMDWQDDVDRWRRDMGQRQGALERRVEAVEEVARLVPDLIERLGPATISVEQQHRV